MPKSVPTAALNLDTMIRFMRSAALTHAMAESAKLEWKTYNDSSLLNAVYFLMPWKEKPGYVEVDIASGKKLHARAAELAGSFSSNWLRTLPQGPGPMKAYLDRLAVVRSQDIDNINSVFRDARSINAEVANELQTAIRSFAVIRLAGTLAVAGLGAFAAIAVGGTTAVIAGGVSAGYSITGSIIKEWNNVPSAQILGVAKEGGKYVAGEGLSRGAEKLLEHATESQQLHQQLMNKAARQIDHYSQMLVQSARQRVKRRAMNKIAQKVVQHDAAEQELKNATRLAKVGEVAKVGVPIVFALWDSIEGVMDFQETWEASR